MASGAHDNQDALFFWFSSCNCVFDNDMMFSIGVCMICGFLYDTVQLNQRYQESIIEKRVSNSSMVHQK